MQFFTGDWDTDSKIMYNYLDKIKLSTKVRKNRNETIPINHYIGDNSGSSLWGLSWRWPCRNFTKVENVNHKGLYYTKCREENKHLYEIFKEYIGIYWKDIIFNELTQVQLNKNFRIPPHKDAQNVGDSLLVGFGDYLGGEINIKKDNEIITHDIRDKGIIFNGALYEHYVNDFTLLNNSNRYSMVIFNDKSLKKEKI